RSLRSTVSRSTFSTLSPYPTLFRSRGLRSSSISGSMPWFWVAFSPSSSGFRGRPRDEYPLRVHRGRPGRLLGLHGALAQHRPAAAGAVADDDGGEPRALPDGSQPLGAAAADLGG